MNNSTATQLSDFAIPELNLDAAKEKQRIPTFINETNKKFRKLFRSRGHTLAKKTPLQEEDVDALWEKVMTCCEDGFLCEYCGEFLNIHPGNKNVFSFDHKNNDYSEFRIDEIRIVCLGCNLFKRNISEKNSESLISLFRTTKNMNFYDKMKEQIVNGIEKGKHSAKAKGIVCHRPRKPIDLDMVKEQYAAGIPLYTIAEKLNVSYSTLRNRLREAKIRVEFLMEKGGTPISE